jgi:hypothetical protein
VFRVGGISADYDVGRLYLAYIHPIAYVETFGCNNHGTI